MQILPPLSAVTNAALVFHIAAGFLSLFVGGALMLMRKGDADHRRLGRIFALAMAGVTASALALTALRPNAFLLTIALFSGYLTLTGWEAIARRRSVSTPWWRALRLWGPPLGGAATAIAMIALAGIEAWSGHEARAIILGAFGAGLAAMTGRDLATARTGGPKGQARTARHLQRMIGAWIASLTAFAVVNLNFLPDLVVWLGPTALISPLIGFWTRRYAPDAPRILS